MTFKISHQKSSFLFVALLSIILSGCVSDFSQLISSDNLFDKPTITTSLSDATSDTSFLDDYDPKSFLPMESLPLTSDGEYILRPGLFELNAWSYCLHPGKYGPGKGAGYVYAPLKGPRADVIRKILRNSLKHQDIPQENIQRLLWAIVERTKISDMSQAAQSAAVRLLSPEDIFEINGGALGLVPDEVTQKIRANMPPEIQKALEAETSLRAMLSRADSAYSDLEKLAVLIGDPTPGKGSRNVPKGRWSYHPGGFFIRYIPEGYSKTKIQIYVPENLHVVRDEKGHISRIVDGKGNRIETEYMEEIGSSSRTYIFNSIKLTDAQNKKSERTFHDVKISLSAKDLNAINEQSSSKLFEFGEYVLATKKAMNVVSVDNDLANEAWMSAYCYAADTGRADFGSAGFWQPDGENQQSVPSYNPDKWNDDAQIQYSNNCYSYAINWPSGHPSYSKPQPGDLSGESFKKTTYENYCEDITAAAIRDGLIKPKKYDPSCDVAEPGETSRQRLVQSAKSNNEQPSNKKTDPEDCCPPGYYKVKLFIGAKESSPHPKNYDYHWYRQDKGGYWSHKPGWGEATNLDASGKLITDPSKANRDYSNDDPPGANYDKECGTLCVPE